jgi:predicted HTH transcriptional regulator
LALLAQNPKLTAPAMAQSLGLTPRAIEKQLAKLKEQGRLRRVGPNKGGHWETLEP